MTLYPGDTRRLNKRRPDFTDNELQATIDYQREAQADWLKPKNAPAQQLLVDLMSRGCAAFVGERSCDERAAGVVMGDCVLKYQTARGVWLNGHADPQTKYAVALCARHRGEGGSRTILMDCSSEIVVKNMTACATWLAGYGIVMDIGVASR